MRRASPIQSFASSPTMVGAITTLIVVVAVFLAYNANNGLPFVPVYRVSVTVPNAARLTHSNEVRIGGTRVGIIDSIEAVRTTPSGQLASDTSSSDTGASGSQSTCCAAAQLNLKLDKSVSPLPEDSIFRVRYRSSFGLKYLEIVRGTGKPAPEGFVFNGLDDNGSCPLPTDLKTFASTEPASSQDGCFQKQTEFDAIANTFNTKTRNAGRADLIGFGTGFAARGSSLNEAVQALAPLLRNLKPVATNLADPSTQLERFITALGATARIVAPVAVAQSQLFTNGAVAFDAISRDPAALEATIAEGVPLLQQGPAELRRERPFLTEVAELSRRLQPGVQQLRVALPVLNGAVKIGTPVLARSAGTSRDLRGLMIQLKRTVQQPSTKISLQRLRETLDQASPLAKWVVPAQTVCNYWNYFFTILPNGLSDRDQVGYSFRQSVIGAPLGDMSLGLPGPTTIPGEVTAPLAGYSGIQSNGIASTLPNPADAGKFEPYSLPILEGHPYGPTGQHNADCQAGQTGYYYGDLPVPGQPKSVPAEGSPDLPGSRGPTTVFYKQDGTRTLRDTRIAAHQP